MSSDCYPQKESYEPSPPQMFKSAEEIVMIAASRHPNDRENSLRARYYLYGESALPPLTPELLALRQECDRERRRKAQAAERARRYRERKAAKKRGKRR